MIHYLLGIPIANAQYASTTLGEATTSQHWFYHIATVGFQELFWSAFGIYAVFALGIGIAIMIWKRIRGTGRRPG